jgi:hypothetical protein
MTFGEEYAKALENDVATLNRVAPNGLCPFCGQNSWHTAEEGGRTLVQAIPAEPGKGFPALTLICDRCGFVRLHSTQTLGIGGLIGGLPE